MKKLCWLLAACLLLGGCGGPGAPAATLPPPTRETPGSAPSLPLPVTEPPVQTQTRETEAPTEVPPTTEAPTEAPPTTEAPVDPVEEALGRLTLEEKVAQLFVVTPEALTGSPGPVTVAGEATREAFDRIPVGGILYMGRNLENPDQVRALCGGMQAISRERLGLPAFLCVDEEGGTVARISGTGRFGIDALPNMSAVGAAGDPEAARDLGRTMGAYLRDLGFNLDFAPDADVWTNPENKIVRWRSFGSDGATVIDLAGALSEGLTEAGILPCWKHFPGHGGTVEDSHAGFAQLPYDWEELVQSEELKPFLAAAEAEIPMIMVGHISVPRATGDQLPASLSEKLISLLRGSETDYQGLLITDALNMGAITSRYTPGEAAVLAIQAGNDLLLEADHLEEAYAAVLRAVEEGELSRERIDESLRRILRVKLGMG